MTQQTDLLKQNLIANIVLTDNFHKTAESGIVSTIVEKVKSLVEAHVDPNDKTGSLINILAPGAVSLLIGGWWGKLIGLALSMMHVDVNSIFKSILSKISSHTQDDKQISSSKIDEIVDSELSSSKTSSIKDAKLIKLAMMTKTSALPATMGAKLMSVIGSVLKLIFKVAFASAGLLVAGDVVNKFIGRPSAIDNTLHHGKTQESTPVITTKQKKFKVKPSYIDKQFNIGTSNQWIESITNNDSSIENMLINFTKEVYDIPNIDAVIKTTPAFNIVKDRIISYNISRPNAPMVFIPPSFKSKKQIVDYFIDQVAEDAP